MDFLQPAGAYDLDMIRITQQDSAKDAKRYYASADYYSQGQEIVGLWGGKGARLLGLEGVVDKLSFERLCDNLHPRDNSQLTARTRSDRTVGYDFTFSVPKSVSLMYAMSGDQQILEAFRQCVSETMRDMESEMKARVRKKGKNDERVTGNMVWAEFIHTTSRPVEGVPDPQLHAHCFVLNQSWDEHERQWKAGQFRDVKRDAPYFQAGFRVRLADKLQELGFGIVRKRDDFEIAGVAASTIKRFSRRTDVIEEAYKVFLAEGLAKLGHGVLDEGKLKIDGVELTDKQILAKAESLGITNATIKAELGAETREKKTKDLSWNELRKEWDSRLTHEERQALASVHRRETRHARPAKGDGQAVDFAIAHCFEREAVTSVRKLLTEALKRGIGSVTVAGVKRELAGRSLIRHEQAGRMMATTTKALAEESQLVAFARKGRGRFRQLGDPSQRLSSDWLNDGQKAAVRHVLGSRDAVTIIRGVFGTGKTTLEQEIGERLAEAGHSVVALAPTAGASDVLRDEAKFSKADTVARFLVDKRMQESVRSGVVLVDEAGMLGTRDMLRLFENAERVKARVVLVGDRRQTRSVSAGEPLRLLEMRSGLPVAEVTEIVRQSGDYKTAAKALSEGRVADALTILDDLKWVKEVPDDRRYQLLADAYLATTRDRKANGEYKSALAVSPTWAEAAKITMAVRSALRAKDKLGKEHTLDIWIPSHLTAAEKADATSMEHGDLLVFHDNAPGFRSGTRVTVADGQKLPTQFADRFEVYRPAKLTIAVGDRVRVTRNGKTKDGKHKLRNGGLFTLHGYTSQGDLVIDHGWVIPKGWGHVALGYAVSAETSQGRTVDKVLVGLSSQSFPAANQRRFGVLVTRGKEQALIFTDSKEGLLNAVERADRPLLATELVGPRRRKLPLRQRLKRHLSFMRRIAAFAATHEQKRNERERTPNLVQENVRER